MAAEPFQEFRADVLSNDVERSLDQMMHFDKELKRAYLFYVNSAEENSDTKRIFCLATERAFELAAEWLLRTCNLLYLSTEDGLVEDKLAPILGVDLARETSLALAEKLRFGTSRFSPEALMTYLSGNILIFEKVEAKLRPSD